MIQKFILSIVTVIMIYCGDIRSQSNEYLFNSKINFENISESNSSNTALKVASILFPLNPIFLIENKKFYVGITKEFSFGKIPFGRIAFEYSLIFRETHLNQIRASYNYDFPLEVKDVAALLFTTGAGYFTDFDKEGYFPQASINLLLPMNGEIGIDAYAKARYTIMTDRNESNIFDFSFGLATVIYF
jgi:hypothetical protein